MTMDEVTAQVGFLLGFPTNENVEEVDLRQAVLIAFRELKRYIRQSVEKTVPFQTRIDLLKQDIHTNKVLNVQAAYPRIGLTMSNIDSGNVFQVAAAVNAYSTIGNTSSINIDPIMSELAMAQVRNTISTDFQWKYDPYNQVVYVTHRDPLPAMITIRYVPDLQDVSEIQGTTWIDYLVRMSLAFAKISLGRSRSKYTIEGSNVTLDGDTLLQEANAELEAIRGELEPKKSRLVVLN